MSMQNMAYYGRRRMTKPGMPMERRRTNGAEDLRIQTLVDATSKQNLPCGSILNEEMKRVKFTKHIIIIGELTDRK
jgi:hypothetical protein